MSASESNSAPASPASDGAFGDGPAPVERRFAGDDLIFAEGAPGDVAYVVVSGRVEIFTAVDDGGELILAHLGPGELFGEMALMSSGSRSASARATEDTVVHEIDRQALLHGTEALPDEAMHLLRRLTDRVRAANQRLAHDAQPRENGTQANMPARRERFWSRMLPWRERAQRTVNEFQTDAVEIEHRPVPAVAVLTLYAILALIAASVAWASLSVIDTVVSTQGRLETTVSNVVVQAVETSVIRELRVIAGQTVRKGDVLARLDETYAEADATATRGTLVSLDAQLARLRAELGQTDPRAFSSQASEDAIQRRNFLNRRKEYDARMRGFERQLARVDEEIRGARVEVGSLDKRVALLQELEEAHRKLLAKKAVARIQYLSTQDSRLAVEHERLQLANATTRLKYQVELVREQREAFTSEWLAKVGGELVEVSRERDQVAEQLKKLERRSENIEITAPVDGIVLDVGEHSVGSVVREAEPLITIVPLDSPLIAAVDITPRDIGKVTLDSEVSLKLEALPFQKHGAIRGTVRFISEDTYERDVHGEKASVYRGQVSLDRNELEHLPPNFRLVPGMNLTGDIQVGKRRLITYFVYPIMRWLDSSFREP